VLEQYEVFHDQAADFPWNCTNDEAINCDGHEGCPHEPRVGQKCGSTSCGREFLQGQMVYLTIPRSEDEEAMWVCWRHIPGLAGPAKAS
jgi:hypothetical protein